MLSREDSDVADAVLEFLHLDGVEVRLNVEVARVDGLSGESVRVSLVTSAGASTVEGSDILAATGRISNTRHIGLEEKSSSETCVSWGLPAHSPKAQMPGAVVSRRSSTTAAPATRRTA